MIYAVEKLRSRGDVVGERTRRFNAYKRRVRPWVEATAACCESGAPVLNIDRRKRASGRRGRQNNRASRLWRDDGSDRTGRGVAGKARRAQGEGWSERRDRRRGRDRREGEVEKRRNADDNTSAVQV